MFQKWCEVTSCDGIIDWYEAKSSRPRFIFWTLVMATMLCLSIYFTFLTIRNYIISPAVTNVATIPRNEMELPEVSICFAGGTNVEAMKKENFSDDLIRDFNIAFSDNKYSNESSVMEYNNYSILKNVTFRENIIAFSFNCEEFIKQVQMSSTGIFITCNEARVVLGVYGRCYIFKPVSTQIWPGMSGGLRIVLQKPNNSFFNYYNYYTQSGSIFDGFYLSFEKHFGFQITDGLALVPPNVRAEIFLNSRKFIRNKKLLLDCDDSPVNYNAYTCYQRKGIKLSLLSLKCIPIFLWDDSYAQNSSICEPFKNYANVDYSQMSEDICLPKCDEWAYEASVSILSLNKPVGHPDISTVLIGYQKMQYTQIEEVSAFTLDMAIANVGGQSGLWIGASLLTFIQAIYYAVLSLCEKCKKVMKKGSAVVKIY